MIEFKCIMPSSTSFYMTEGLQTALYCQIQNLLVYSYTAARQIRKKQITEKTRLNFSVREEQILRTKIVLKAMNANLSQTSEPFCAWSNFNIITDISLCHL